MNLEEGGERERSPPLGGNERERCRGLPIKMSCDEVSVREPRPRGLSPADNERSGTDRQERESGRPETPADPANFAEVLRLS
jgi:hypothetical protein